MPIRDRKRSRAGRFVVLVGPDGVGKTTTASALVALSAGPTAYFHFRPPLRGLLPAPPESMAAPPEKQRESGWMIAGWLRLAKNVLLCWLGYLMTVRPALGRGTTVIGDRWSYGYVVQPLAVRFYGPRWLALAGIRLLPRPDLVANLTAEVEEILARKQELGAVEVREELQHWRSLPVRELRTYESAASPECVARRILADLGA